MNNLGTLLAESEPTALDGARSWLEQAAARGHTGAIVNLGRLLATSDPPDLDGARRWYEQAAAQGSTDAMVNLGTLLVASEPPDIDAARRWYLTAANVEHACPGRWERACAMASPRSYAPHTHFEMRWAGALSRDVADSVRAVVGEKAVHAGRPPTLHLCHFHMEHTDRLDDNARVGRRLSLPPQGLAP